ncbi:MAG: M48 family metallopeptidase [Flammeovirgaceae bacterium]
MNDLANYPDSPHIQDPLFLEPTEEYQNQVQRVAKGISVFVGTYITMLAVTVGLSAACIAFGIFLLKSFTILTAFISAGVMGIGAMLLSFFAKSLFASRKPKHEGKIEITASNEPELYEFVHMVCAEVGADVPNKIYLAPDINAWVSYESTFWSLFKPVKKDLTIGIGLMNCQNMSEFKGVLAHEFGHFSQKSMKLNSYVYTMNRIIYDLVYNYDSWDHTINKWANAGGLWGLFGKVPKAFADGVRFILRKLYEPINLRMMELLRQMEFHADKFAVYAAGSHANVSGLRRIDFAGRAHRFAIQKLSQALSMGLKTDNIFKVQRWAIKHLAQKHHMELEYGLPVITDKHLAQLNKARITYTDQWASHPNLADSEANMMNPVVHAEISKANPLHLFTDAEKWEKEFTKELYKDIPNEKVLDVTPIDEIIKKLDEEMARYTIPKIFNNYYDDRVLDEFNIEKLIKKFEKGKIELNSFEEIFSPEHQAKIERYQYDLEDIQTLDYMDKGYINTKFFEFEGKRYPISEAKAGIKKLQKDADRAERWLKENDKQAFLFFYQLGKKLGKSEDYVNVFREQFAFRGNMAMCSEWLGAIQLRYFVLRASDEITHEDLRIFVEEIAGIEDAFKNALYFAQKEGELKGLPKSLEKVIKEYLADKNNYFIGGHYDSEQFSGFWNLVTDVQIHFANLYHERLAEIFKYQESLLRKTLNEGNEEKEKVVE